MSALRPGRFTPELGAPGTYWIEGSLGPETGLNGLGKRKLVAFAGSRTSISLGRPACGLVNITDSGLTASLCGIHAISNYVIIIIIIVFLRLQLQNFMSVRVGQTLPLEDSIA